MTDVRFAVAGDLPALVELGRAMHVESRYGWMVYAADRVWKQLEELIERKDWCVLVATEAASAELEGFLIGSIHQYLFANDFAANLEFFYLTPSRRRGLTAMKMFTAFRRWAANRGVSEITLSNRFGANEAYVGKLFARLGMPAVGGMHAAWVEQR